MAVVFMTDPNTGRCALYDENGTTGEPDDPNSVRNAPLNNPSIHLDKIYFHSDLDYMEVAFEGTTVINHPAVPAAPGSTTTTDNVQYGGAAADHLLATHNLGYVPTAMVSRGSNIITPGYPIYANANCYRFVTAYCTSTQLRLYEDALRAGSGSAQTITYEWKIFREVPISTNTLLMDYDPVTSTVQMGLGKFNSSRKYLQVIVGGSPYFFPIGRTADLNNGAIRIVDAVGNVFDPVLSGLRSRLANPSNTPYGNLMTYNGSFTGGQVIQVKVP